jgi:hypothetical protein
VGTGGDLLRSLVPETLTPAAPVAFRDVLVRIAVQVVTGRDAFGPEGGATA